MSRDTVILRDILFAIEVVQAAVAGGHDAYIQSQLAKDATLYCLVVIGEATTRLSDDLKMRNPHVDWRSIRRFRNIAVHDYGNVDLEIVWQIIQNDLPVLAQQINAILIDIDSDNTKS